MKKAIKLTLAVVLVMGSTSLFAQKFGRINTQEIIMAMPETKTMQENMDTFAKELSDNIETMNVEFNTKLQDFQKNYTPQRRHQGGEGEGAERYADPYPRVPGARTAGLPEETERTARPDHRQGEKRHRQGSGRRRIPGRVRHFDGIAGLFRRSYADGRCTRREEGTGHHRRPRSSSTCRQINLHAEHPADRPSSADLTGRRFRFHGPAGRKARGSVHKVEESDFLNDNQRIIIIFVEIQAKQ